MTSLPELKKAKCPYCGQELELDITAFCRWTIRARCAACGKEIDFGFKPPLRPVAWICGQCKRVFKEMARDSHGRSITPCCHARRWLPLYTEEVPAEGTFVI